MAGCDLGKETSELSLPDPERENVRLLLDNSQGFSRPACRHHRTVLQQIIRGSLQKVGFLGF
jgi:hypothetical protein